MKRALMPFAGFCYVWLMIGFFTGTLVLLGPARWLTRAVQAHGWSQRSEDFAMMGLIAVYVLASAAIAWLVFRRTARCQTRRLRFGIPASLTVAAAVCLWLWMDPARLAGAAGGGVSSAIKAGSAQFVFGPYPDRPRLEQLKKEGFTSVISLQHPAIVPFEPQGIAAEKSAAAEIGLEFIHAPMMPWVSSNDASLEQIRQIAKTGKGRYYVHCGLGRDRVNIVKRMLELEGAKTAVDEKLMDAGSFAKRFAEKRPMERGRIERLDEDVWMIPYPNKHELFGNMLAGQVQHVTVALDPKDPAQKTWLEEIRTQLTDFKVPFSVVPGGSDAAHAQQVARTARSAARPEVVIVPFTAPQSANSVAMATAIQEAYGGSGR